MRGWDKGLWERLSPMLDRALDLDPADQTRFLSAVRSEDPDAAAALERLLAEHDQVLASAFLETPPIAGLAPATLAGQTAGAYTLERPIGMGGMGMVWLARRSDGRFEGTVALKFVNLALLDAAGQERFRREGTLLARLSHPNITRLLDAGVTAAGQPFLVLEYVEGIRIDRFAADHQLGIDGRLALFLQMAEAVAHAHANLVLHRDLKPSNVLVDTHGQVKLLDFGVATLLDSEESGRPAPVTATGRALTPEYAAPEQLTGSNITTATDVYALGVILYQLLIGYHPTASAGSTYAAMLQAVAKEEPPRLTDRVRRWTDGDLQAAQILAERGISRDRLQRTCQGDLDAILGRALKRSPAERYQTVTAFAEDITRYQRGEPVVARPDRWSYRARKFIRRHRAGVAAAAVMILMLSTAVAITSREMIEARRQRDRAEFQAKRATASSEFMRYLVTQIGDKPMTMREVLDRGRIALEQQHQNDPAFVARMLVQLSGPYIEAGDVKTAGQMMARALEIALTLGDPDLLATTHCGRAYDLLEERDFDGARRHLAEGGRNAQRAFSPSLNAECAMGETRLAVLERRPQDAVRHASRAVDLLEQAGITTTTRYTSALDTLGRALNGADRLPEALAAHRKVTDVSRRIGRGETIGVVVSLQNEATVLRRLGRWLESDRRFAEAATLASRSGRVPGYLLANHARLLAELRRDDEARVALDRARAQGDLTPAFAAVGQLAEALLRIEDGDASGARAIYSTYQNPQQTALPEMHWHAMRILGARIARADGHVPEARAIVDQAIDESGFPATLSTAQPELLEFAARISLDLGDLDVAVQRSRHAIHVIASLYGREAPSAYAGRAHLTLGMAFAAKGSTREAKSELEQASAILEQRPGIRTPGPSKPVRDWALSISDRPRDRAARRAARPAPWPSRAE
jgi:eukaryotic-like serine/threonine-protein kinase